MRARWRDLPAPPLLHLLLLLLLLPPTLSLTCLTCIPTVDSTQLDRFRVSTRLTRPFCPMEKIECDRDQDVCVTVTMHIGGGEYWLGAGCDRRSNFAQAPSNTCHNVRTLARSVQLGYVHERRAMQRVCVCARDLCNTSSSHLLPWILLLLLLLRI